MLTNVKNWKFLVKSEVENLSGSSVKVYDGHFDGWFAYDVVICNIEGLDYLCGYDFHCKKIFPLVERDGRLEVLNTLTVGYVDGTELKVCNVFKENVKLYWNDKVASNNEIDEIENKIKTKLENGDYAKSDCGLSKKLKRNLNCNA